MQATVNSKGFFADRIKVGLVAAGLLASTIAGIAAVTLTNDGAADIAAPPAVVADTEAQRQPHNPRARINELSALAQSRAAAAAAMSDNPRARIGELVAARTAANYAQLMSAKYELLWRESLSDAPTTTELDYAELMSLKYELLFNESK